MTRDELIAVGAMAIMGPAEPAPGEMDGCRSLAEDILDAVGPLIRADERERVSIELERPAAITARREVRADMRAKVEALLAHETAPDQPVEQAWNLAILKVLALIDGADR